MGKHATVAMEPPGQLHRPHVTGWERFSFECTRFGVRLLLRLLSLRGLYQVGRGFGTLEWLTNYKRRRRAMRVLDDVQGHELSVSQRRRAAWRYFMRARNDKMFFLVMDHISKATLLGHVTVRNRPLLDEALAMGKGAYIALSHHGAQHVGTAFLVQLGYRVGGVRDPREGASRRFMQEKLDAKQRARIVYFHSDTFPRVLFRWLGANGILTSAIDVTRVRDERQKFLTLHSLGKDRPFLTGPFQLALRCGAPIFQGFIISRANFHYEFDLRGPLVDPASEGASEAAVRKAIKAYAAGIEEFTRRYPCHVSRV